jgi:D-alanine-D-alanine ligase
MARFAVAFNDDVHLKHHLNDVELLGEAEVSDTASEIAELLGADLVPVRDDIPAALRRLATCDVVVNLCEGVLGNPRLEMNFALALEMLGVAFTGCDPLAVAICTDKALVKRLLEARGIPTPLGTAVTHAGDVRHIPMFAAAQESRSWIVKPSREDAGIGIDAGSIVSTVDELEARVRHVVEHYRQPALVEEFIDGRELNQAVYCGISLPVGEVLFSEQLAPRERVVGWKAKWAAGSREDLGTVNRTPAEIDDVTREGVTSICSAVASTLSIGGYCRFDLRQARTGELYVVDVNPNPDIGRGTGFRRALDAAGVSFSEFLGALIMAARERRKR